jgi:hypothetical protein
VQTENRINPLRGSLSAACAVRGDCDLARRTDRPLAGSPAAASYAMGRPRRPRPTTEQVRRASTMARACASGTESALRRVSARRARVVSRPGRGNRGPGCPSHSSLRDSLRYGKNASVLSGSGIRDGPARPAAAGRTRPPGPPRPAGAASAGGGAEARTGVVESAVEGTPGSGESGSQRAEGAADATAATAAVGGPSGLGLRHVRARACARPLRASARGARRERVGHGGRGP